MVQLSPIAFLPRSNCLLLSWLQSPSAVILEPHKIKFVTVSSVSPSICHELMGPDAMIFVFWMLWLVAFVWISITLRRGPICRWKQMLCPGISMLQMWERAPCFSKQTGKKQNWSLPLRGTAWDGCAPRVCWSDQVILRVRHCYCFPFWLTRFCRTGVPLQITGSLSCPTAP